MPLYKLWVEVEEYDPATDEHHQLTETDGLEPCLLGQFEGTIRELYECLERLERSGTL